MSNPFIQPVSDNLTRVISILSLLIFLPFLMYGAIMIKDTLRSRASGTKASITVNASETVGTVSMDFMKCLAQGGEEAGDMIMPVFDQTKALSPQFIRIDHIYDHYDVVGRNGAGLTFNWSKLDQFVDTITKVGAKPILALSYMPSVIAKDGVIINVPNDWNEWATVVRKTVEHYSGRGEKNMGGVYYEVWNEPDLDQFGSWKQSGEKNYFTLYRYAAQGAQSASNVNQFFIGGPATTGMYATWMINLARSGMRVDFYSWHTYQKDANRFSQDQKNLVAALLPINALGKPMIISEFSFDGGKNILYSGNYAAAHTIAVARELIAAGPMAACTFEIKDGPNDANDAGWGLIRNESRGKTTKPRYAVFPFLNRMNGTRLGLVGEGTWVGGFAIKSNQTYRILLVNFDQYNASTEEFVPLTIAHLPAGSYTVKTDRLFGGDDPTVTVAASDSQPITRTVRLARNDAVIVELSPATQ
jgi:beta-xylosidase